MKQAAVNQPHGWSSTGKPATEPLGKTLTFKPLSCPEDRRRYRFAAEDFTIKNDGINFDCKNHIDTTLISLHKLIDLTDYVF